MVSSESAMVTASPPQLSRDSRVSGKSSSLPYAYVSYGDHASWNICRTRVRAHNQRSGASSDVEQRMDAFIQNSRGGVLRECAHSQFVQSPPKLCIVRLPPMSVYVITVDPIFSGRNPFLAQVERAAPRTCTHRGGRSFSRAGKACYSSACTCRRPPMHSAKRGALTHAPCSTAIQSTNAVIAMSTTNAADQPLVPGHPCGRIRRRRPHFQRWMSTLQRLVCRANRPRASACRQVSSVHSPM